jgi:hypothetical protein
VVETENVNSALAHSNSTIQSSFDGGSTQSDFTLADYSEDDYQTPFPVPEFAHGYGSEIPPSLGPNEHYQNPPQLQHLGQPRDQFDDSAGPIVPAAIDIDEEAELDKQIAWVCLCSNVL